MRIPKNAAGWYHLFMVLFWASTMPITSYRIWQAFKQDKRIAALYPSDEYPDCRRPKDCAVDKGGYFYMCVPCQKRGRKLRNY